MDSEQPKTARIDARLPSQVLELIKTAADLQGRTLSDFVVGSAREAAERAIESRASILLLVEDQIRFADALLSPSEPSPAMRRAAEAHARLIQSESVPPESESES